MQVDVVIVGAGPAGLMLANQLQRRGIRLLLLESRAYREDTGRAVEVNGRVLEIFDQMGLLNELLGCGLLLKAENTSTTVRREFGSQDNPYGVLSISRFDAEEILERELRRRFGTIHWSSELVGLERNFSGVEVEWTSAGQNQRAQCRYLVGCDGRHSFVRRRLELNQEQQPGPQQCLLAEVGLSWSLAEDEIWNFRLSDNALRVTPLPGRPRRYQLSYRVPVEDSLGPLERLRQDCLPAFPAGSQIEELGPHAFFSLNQQAVENYRRGNCFLVGQAASFGAPEDGACLNRGLREAFNLGWKLASVLRGEALDSLLDSYHQECHPKSGGPDSKRAAAGKVPAGQRGAAPGEVLDYIQGLTRPGLAPRFRLVECLRHGDFQLIGFGGDWDGLADLAERLGEVFGNQLHCLAITDPDERRPPDDLAWVIDSEGQAGKAWGEGPGAILVRPDGHVGWRGLPRTDESLDRFLVQVSLNLRA
ncbi:FAD-dependent monooxygenase [bacterium]|nr:FAD-dependent monooxygenase [bacterium]